MLRPRKGQIGVLLALVPWFLDMWIAMGIVRAYGVVMTRAEIMFDLLIPLSVIILLLGCGALYQRRSLHGALLVAICCASFVPLFPYHFVEMTGGV